MNRNTQDRALATAASERATDPLADLEPSRTVTEQVLGRRSHHDQRGRWALGNTERLKDGRYSKQVAAGLLPEQRALVDHLAQHESAIAVDLGGASELSTFERDLVSKYQMLDNLAMFNAPRMLASRASVRREAREAFLQAIDRQLKIIGLLGSRRRQKHVNETPAQWLMRTRVERQIDEADEDQHRIGGDIVTLPAGSLRQFLKRYPELQAELDEMLEQRLGRERRQHRGEMERREKQHAAAMAELRMEIIRLQQQRERQTVSHRLGEILSSLSGGFADVL